MNLLTDNWIPVQKNSKQQLIGLQDILCRDEDWTLTLPRDDMEMACLQLIICLTQVIFTPSDAKSWRVKAKKTMNQDEYQKGILSYMDWFDLNHPSTPFMQIRGVKSTKTTPIQKLFVGLPEGNNHCFFNDAGELKAVDESAAAIALFNQAMNSPSFGGGFKGGFRGGAPISTFIYQKSLRRMIWSNVLHEDSLRKIMPEYDQLKMHDKPVWVEPIKGKSNISANSIGLLRGLFWQPAHIELIFSGSGVCQYSGNHSEKLVTAFNKEKFVYNIAGQWLHPHSPQYWLKKKTGVEFKYASFTTTAPAWTHLSRFLIPHHSEKEGQQPATVVKQFSKIMKNTSLVLTVGGYRNKQASILQRRHELIGLSKDWEANRDSLDEMVKVAMQIKTALRSKLYGFGKKSGAHAVPEQAEALFYQNSEALIHSTLRQMDWREAKQVKASLIKKLIKISWDIVHQVILPYQNEPEMILATSTVKRTLASEFKKIKGA